MLVEKNKTSSLSKDISKFTFIDLFAGIGGFHLAMKSLGGKCIFASEWDKYACETYEANYNIRPYGDITKIRENDIPAHDVLCAGFPCQAFSISGKQKGFEDTRGTLFFDIARIVGYHKPKAIFLENVKQLEKHNNGETLNIILNTLKDLEYSVFYKVLNSSHFGLPQNRERIYIVAFHKSLETSDFKFPHPTYEKVSLLNVLEKEPENGKTIERDDIEIYKNFQTNHTLFEEYQYPNKPIQIGKVNKGGQGERIYHPMGHSITLSAYGGGVGSKTGLYLIDGKVRKLSPRECARLQGFPENFILNKSVTQCYKQFGNSVSVKVLEYIGAEIVKTMSQK